jgi:hypothetical protein
MRASSAALLGLALALLVFGVLLTPNVVLADEPIGPDGGFVACACTGTCAGQNSACNPPGTCLPNPPSNCTNANGQTCSCKANPKSPGFCTCQ